MGIVETLRQKKGPAMGGAIAMLLLATLSMAYQLWPQKHYSQNKTFFSDDDGATWYADDADKVPPCDHNGKQAVRATIFSYDHGSKQFCGYLMRFGPAAYKLLGNAIAEGARKTPPETAQGIMFDQDFSNSSEVKKPNSNDPWIPIGNQKAQSILNVKSPDGSVIDSVLP